jgi:hypothetical protein
MFIPEIREIFVRSIPGFCLINSKISRLSGRSSALEVEILRNPRNLNRRVFSRGFVTTGGAADAQADLSGQHIGNEGGALTGTEVCIGTLSLQHPLHCCTGMVHPVDPLLVLWDTGSAPDTAPGMKALADETIRSATIRNAVHFMADGFQGLLFTFYQRGSFLSGLFDRTELYFAIAFVSIERGVCEKRFIIRC